MNKINLVSEYIPTNNIKLHCKIAGEGETVILLHGFPEFWYAWKKTIPFLSEKGYKVVAPDMRGYNKSDVPKGIDQYHIDVLVEDIVGLIKATSKNNKASIVGHDWGGAIAWELAKKHPKMVDKLIILNSPYPTEFKKALKRNIFQIWKSKYFLFFQIRKFPEWYISRNLTNFFKKVLQKDSVNSEAVKDSDIEKYVEAFSDRKNLTASINYYRALNLNNNKPKEETDREASETKEKGIVEIHNPVLIIWGNQDRYIGRELVFNTAKYCFSKPEINYLKDASHWLHHEKPSEVHSLILRFLNRKHLAVDFNLSKNIGFGENSNIIKNKV